MSEENLQLVRREYRAFATRDWSVLPEIWHPQIEYDLLTGETFRGIDEVTEFFDSYSALYSEFRVEAVEMVNAGDKIVTLERHAARGPKGSSADAWMQDSFACLTSFKDGKIWRIEEYPTLEEALEAAGLSE